MPRRILHLDLDAFFCAVEELRDPSLMGRPFAVGGRPEERGVVASCSYAARRFGVRSAMPMGRALRQCPGLLIVSSHYKLYSQYSHKVMEYLHEVTELVEQVSIDEAFMDVSDLPRSGEEIARELQRVIRSELSLPCSLGVASNKLVAKIANDYGKSDAPREGPPNAITIVPDGKEAEFLAPLTVERLWGVGPKTAARLAEIGVKTIGELANCSESDLMRLFGKNGRDLARHAQGIDDQPIITYHEPKSISQETTFVHDVRDDQVLRQTMHSLSAMVGQHLRNNGYAGSTIKIKLRWPNFTTLTRQITLACPTDQDQEIYQAALALFEKAWQPGKAVRLIGVGVSNLGPPARQLNLWDPGTFIGKDSGK